MRVVSQLLPRTVRNGLRRSIDSLYSKPFPDKLTIGDRSPWTIVTRELGPHAVVYSGGVGEDITFEQELIRRFGVRVHIFDPSPVAVETVAQANEPNLVFKPLGLTGSGVGRFCVGGGVGANTWLKSGEGDEFACTTLLKEMELNHHAVIDLLKIDIEGFEYDVLEGCLAHRVPIKQLCIEFHDFFPEISRQKTRNAIKLLRSGGFELIHRHRHDHTFLFQKS